MKLTKKFRAVLVLFFLAIAFMDLAHGYNAQVSYTQDYTSSSLMVGSESIQISNPDYACGVGGGETVTYPKPKIECWKIRAVFEDKIFILTPGQPTEISEHLTLTCTPSAKLSWVPDYQIYAYEKQSDWENRCTLTVKNFEIKAKVDLPTNQVVLDEDLQILLTTENDLGDFQASMAGAFVRKQNDLLFRDEPWETLKFKIDKSSSSITLDADTSEIGEITVEIQPYLKIKGDNQIILPSEDMIEATYLVTPNVGSYQKPSALQRLILFILGWFK